MYILNFRTWMILFLDILYVRCISMLETKTYTWESSGIVCIVWYQVGGYLLKRLAQATWGACSCCSCERAGWKTEKQAGDSSCWGQSSLWQQHGLCTLACELVDNLCSFEVWHLLKLGSVMGWNIPGDTYLQDKVKLRTNTRVFPEMAYTKSMTTCMLHFLESYPESCPRIIPANHTTNHTHDFEAMFWNIRLNS